MVLITFGSVQMKFPTNDQKTLCKRRKKDLFIHNVWSINNNKYKFFSYYFDCKTTPSLKSKSQKVKGQRGKVTELKVTESKSKSQRSKSKTQSVKESKVKESKVKKSK